MAQMYQTETFSLTCWAGFLFFALQIDFNLKVLFTAIVPGTIGQLDAPLMSDMSLPKKWWHTERKSTFQMLKILFNLFTTSHNSQAEPKYCKLDFISAKSKPGATLQSCTGCLIEENREWILNASLTMYKKTGLLLRDWCGALSPRHKTCLICCLTSMDKGRGIHCDMELDGQQQGFKKKHKRRGLHY